MFVDDQEPLRARPGNEGLGSSEGPRVKCAPFPHRVEFTALQSFA